MQAVFHAFANYSDDRKSSAKNYTEYGVEDEADEDESDDEVCNPAGGGVIVPEEMPGFFSVVFECVAHVLVRWRMTFKKVFISWGDLYG